MSYTNSVNASFCTIDIVDCALACLVPCIATGQLEQMQGNGFIGGCCGGFCCCALYTGCQRHSTLLGMNKSSGCVVDFLVGCCCPICSTVQLCAEVREHSKTKALLMQAPTTTVIIQGGNYPQQNYPQQNYNGTIPNAAAPMPSQNPYANAGAPANY